MKVAVMLAALVLAFADTCVSGERNITLPWGPKPKRGYSLDIGGIFEFPEEMSGGYMKLDGLRLSRYNDTVRILVFVGNIKVMKDLPETAVITLVGHQRKANNDFSKIPFNFIKRNLCEFIENDYLFYYDLLKHSNFTAKCPVVKGEYSISNYIVNEYYLPPELPGDHWRVYWTIFDKPKGQIIFKIAIDFFLDHPYRVAPIP